MINVGEPGEANPYAAPRGIERSVRPSTHWLPFAIQFTLFFNGAVILAGSLLYVWLDPSRVSPAELVFLQGAFSMAVTGALVSGTATVTRVVRSRMTR